MTIENIVNIAHRVMKALVGTSQKTKTINEIKECQSELRESIIDWKAEQLRRDEEIHDELVSIRRLLYSMSPPRKL